MTNSPYFANRKAFLCQFRLSWTERESFGKMHKQQIRMIIFINGAFGAGKSTVATLLVKAVPNSILYDPEEIGLALRTILEPIEKYDDFQHYPEWRTLTIEVAKQIKGRHNRHLIVPMTIWRQEYFKEVTDGLRKVDPKFKHFCLTVSIESIYQRLDQRGEQKPDSWAHQQAEKAVSSFKSPLFAQHVDAEKNSPEQLVKIILSQI